MNDTEFKKWPKIPRGGPLTVTITEKIDGTNACIIIQEGEIVGIQSRRIFITPEKDNYGFARWVGENKKELLSLGEGYHYGEWAGHGIQKNPLGLDKKYFFLFNTYRWNDSCQGKPDCCKVVPVLYQGELNPGIIPTILNNMRKRESDVVQEGVVVYHHACRSYTKHTVKTPDGKWLK